jgi:hypothetical protein
MSWPVRCIWSHAARRHVVALPWFEAVAKRPRCSDNAPGSSGDPARSTHCECARTRAIVKSAPSVHSASFQTAPKHPRHQGTARYIAIARTASANLDSPVRPTALRVQSPQCVWLHAVIHGNCYVVSILSLHVGTVLLFEPHHSQLTAKSSPLSLEAALIGVTGVSLREISLPGVIVVSTCRPGYATTARMSCNMCTRSAA